MSVQVEQVKQALQASWSPGTSSIPEEWTKDNPARGQCVPSSLVVQHLLGGELEKLGVSYLGKPEIHYRNILPNGSVVDTTRGQYPEDQVFNPMTVDLKGHASIRDKRLANSETNRRYQLLLALVLKNLVQSS